MPQRPSLRCPRAVTGALVLVAAAPAAAHADPAGVASRLADPTVAYGAPAVLTGRVTSGRGDDVVALQFRPPGAPAWTTLRRGVTLPGGRFRLAAGLRRSGTVRVVAAPGPAVARTAATPGLQAGAQRTVRVAAAVVARSGRRDVLVGRTATVAGVLRPGGAGRAVALQVRAGAGTSWRTVDRDRTDAAGRWALRLRTRQTGSTAARVRFAGDKGNATTARPIGRLNAYRRAFASWYGPGLYGNRLGCGGRLTPSTLGVAHKGLPCGTLVTLRYRGRSVRVPVVDRGPYVRGREFDLTAATRAALGFGSTGFVWTTR